MSRSLLSFLLLIAATLVVFFWKTAGFYCLHFFSVTYSFLMHSLQSFIRDHSVRQIVVVLFASLLLGLIPVFIYWIFHRRWFYEYMSFVWCVWLVLITMILMKGVHA